MAELTSEQAKERELKSAAGRHERNSENVDLAVKSLSEDLLKELKDVVSLDTRLISRELDKFDFKKYAKVFNSSIQSPACLVARPTRTMDVSQIVKFARKHDFSISVKSGGHGVSGHAILGDIIIDMGAMDSIEIDPPTRTGKLTLDKGVDYQSLQYRKEKGKRADSSQFTWPGNPLGDGILESIAYRISPDAITPADYLVLPLAFDKVGMPSPYNQGKIGSPFDNYALSGRGLGESPPGIFKGSHSDSVLLSKLNLSLQSHAQENASLEREGVIGKTPTAEEYREVEAVPSHFSNYDNSLAANDPFAYMRDRPTSSSRTYDNSPASSDPLANTASHPTLPSRSVSTPRSQTSSSRDREPFNFRDTSTLPSINHAQVDPSHPKPQRLPFDFENPTTPLPSTSTTTHIHDEAFIQRYHSSYYRDPQLSYNFSHPDFGSRSSLSHPDVRAPWSTRNHTFDPHSLSTLRTPATEVHVKDHQAFVAFGAGARQRDIDLYTHSHPLPAVDMNGQKTAVPYHVPL